MSDIFSSLSRFAGNIGRVGSALGTFGLSELARNDRKDMGSILAGDQIPNFLRPGQTTDSYTPEQFQEAKNRQLYNLGTPEATAIANKFIETPELQLQKANVASEIADRTAQRDIQRSQLALQRDEQAQTKADKDRNYALAVKELEAKLKGGLRDPKDIFDQEAKLRNEFVNQSKDFTARRDAYDNIKSLSGGSGGANDIALLVSFMKMQDPGSTVNSGEFATVENAGGVPEKVRNQYNKILTGDKLTPDVRKTYVTAADSTFKSAERQHAKRAEQYKGLAERAGVNPNQVIVDLGIAEKPKDAPKITGGIKFLGFK